MLVQLIILLGVRAAAASVSRPAPPPPGPPDHARAVYLTDYPRAVCLGKTRVGRHRERNAVHPSSKFLKM